MIVVVGPDPDQMKVGRFVQGRTNPAEASPALVGMKGQDLQDPDSTKAVYYVGLVHRSQSPRSRTSSASSTDQATVLAQHDAVHSEAAILVKVPVA